MKSKMCSQSIILLAILLSMFALTVQCIADDTSSVQVAASDLTDMSLEQLMNVQVTSVSKKVEKLSDSAAAVYVINQEDIRRSGLTSIPELLRMVPGLQVGHINASRWGISARGFNDLSANKLLVLIDGRSVYTPQFSGVWWDTQDLMLEDIDRIEVIRGPGAALWGANAVNGVVNVVSKDAHDTNGSLAVSQLASGDLSKMGAFRYGGTTSNGISYRAYVKTTEYNGFSNPDGSKANDAWSQNRAGFRMDWNRTEDTSYTMQGDIYGMKTNADYHVGILAPPLLATVVDEGNNSGGNIIFRWNHAISPQKSTSLQLYADRALRNDTVINNETRNNFDVDFQTRQDHGVHECVWGLGYRRTSDSIQPGLIASFTPKDQTTNLYSMFWQDEITIKPDHFKLTVGSRLEHNDYTGFEVQPNIRALWTPSDKQTVWAAVSRAVRTPSRVEENVAIKFSTFQLPNNMIAQATVLGNTDLRSEALIAHELGYRIQPNYRTFLDMALFYNVYNNIRGLTRGNPTVRDGKLIIPIGAENNVSAITRGLELSANWKPTSNWRVAAEASWLDMNLYEAPTSMDVTTPGYRTNFPNNQYNLRSYLDISDKLEFDTALYWVGSSKSLHIIDAQLEIPAYTRLDLRLGWKFQDDSELSLGIQNALDNRHYEAGSGLGEIPTQVVRSTYLKLEHHF